jgi:hypothetical protein
LQSHGLPLLHFSSLDLLPEEIFGTEEVPEYILSDSSKEEEDATPEQRVNHQLRRRIRHLEHSLRHITTHCNAERECRMSLEALVGVKLSSLFDSMFRLRSSYSNNCSSPLYVSDRYSNLKAAWDSLMEAASHSHPRSFQVAVTVVLEQLKREELRKQNKKNE